MFATKRRQVSLEFQMTDSPPPLESSKAERGEDASEMAEFCLKAIDALKIRREACDQALAAVDEQRAVLEARNRKFCNKKEKENNSLSERVGALRDRISQSLADKNQAAARVKDLRGSSATKNEVKSAVGALVLASRKVQRNEDELTELERTIAKSGRQYQDHANCVYNRECELKSQKNELQAQRAQLEESNLFFSTLFNVSLRYSME